MAFDKKKIINNNINAIDAAFEIKNGKATTSEDIEILRKYAGWGGIKEVLLPIDDLSSWTQTDQKVYNEIKQLHEILRKNTSDDEKQYIYNAIINLT